MIPLTQILCDRVNVSEHIRARKEGRVLVLNLTSRCTLRCVYCYASAGIHVQDLDYDALSKNVLSKLESINTSVVILSGGEPTLYPHFTKLLENLSGRNVSIVISTCGMYIDEERCKLFKEYSIPYVGVSIDVGLQEVESKIRVGVDLNKIFNTIRLLRRYDIQVGIRSVLTLPSAYGVEHLINICRKLDVRRLCIYNLVPTGRARSMNTLLKLNDELYVKFLLYLMTKIVPENKDIDILMVTEPSTYILACLLRAKSREEFHMLLDRYSRRCACSAGTKIVSIYPDGTYNPCQFFKVEDHIKVSDTTLDIALRQLQEKYGQLRCASCPLSDFCRGCIVKMQVENISFNTDCTILKLWRTKVYTRLEDWKKRVVKEIVQNVLGSTKGD